MPRGEQWYGKRVNGLLPRSDLFTGPRLRDAVKVIPESEWGNYPTNVQSRVHFILDQKQTGSCASEATSQCTMILRAVAGLSPVVLNPWSLYPYVNGGQDQGSTLDANVEASKKVGIIPMDLWGRDKGWQTPIPANLKEEALKYRITEWFEINSKAEFGTAIVLGYPVFYGRDAHAITAVGLYKDGVKYANSWGKTWTDINEIGFGYDPWSKLIQAITQYGCFAARTPVYPGA